MASGPAWMGIHPIVRPARSTAASLVVRVAAARIGASRCICSTTLSAGPRTSTGLPLERCSPARSTTVVVIPLRARK